jgi:hypothetical protein
MLRLAAFGRPVDCARHSALWSWDTSSAPAGRHVETKTGAAHGERSPDRLSQRNGYRARTWETRVGTIELRKGSYFPESQSAPKSDPRSASNPDPLLRVTDAGRPGSP